MYTRFTWVGNKISDKDMESLYKLKALTRKTITKMVAEAAKLYLGTFTEVTHENSMS